MSEPNMTDDLVTQAAKIIAPGAFQEWAWMDGTGKDAKPVPEPTLSRSRRAYQRAEARRQAAEILKLAANTANLRRILAEIEKDDWVKLGIPVRGVEEAERIIEQKYDLPAGMQAIALRALASSVAPTPPEKGRDDGTR